MRIRDNVAPGSIYSSEFEHLQQKEVAKMISLISLSTLHLQKHACVCVCTCPSHGWDNNDLISIST